MGDAFTHVGDFAFLRKEFTATQSLEGQQHLWLWLTKRPANMGKFADSIGGFPANVCAMTTVTSRDTLHRVDGLRAVDAQVKGLSLEPLWSDIADDLDLTGIDWVIVGGESGARDMAAPFPIEWAQKVHALCKRRGVAFFLKQLGSNPTLHGEPFELSTRHGGDWEEWPEQICNREFPAYFDYYAKLPGTPCAKN